MQRGQAVQIVYALTHQIVVLSFVGLLTWAAINDSRHFIIPNRIPIAIAALYPAHVLASPIPVAWAYAIVIALVIFVLFAIFFHLNMMGGGDVKLMAATALWAGIHHALTLVVMTALIGGVFAFAMLVHARLFAPKAAEAGNATGWRARLIPTIRARVPYGVAIAGGGVFVAVRLFSS